MTREEAIGILERMQEPEPYEPQINERIYEALEVAIESLQKPEIIRCKDCKKWHTNCLAVCEKHGCDVVSDYTKPDDYCSWAERRTDG